MKSLENSLQDAGGCGRFQVVQLLAINSVRFVAMWGILIMAFGNYNPGWRCLQRANLTDLAYDAQEEKVPLSRYVNGSLKLQRGNNLTFGTRDGDVIDTEGRNLNVSTLGMKGDVYQSDCHGFDSCSDVRFKPGTKTIVTEWGLACQHTWMVSLAISIQMAGLFFGCASAGQISERLGRRTALYGSSALHGVASLVASFSVSWLMYALCLFFVGVGSGGILTVALVYSFEFLEPRWRGILGGLPLVNLSQTAFSLLVFLERDWRHLHITIAAISGIITVPVFWVPESTRWLAVHGRIKEAKAVIDKIARTNGCRCDEEDVMATLVALKEAHRKEGKQRQYSYLDLFQEKTLRAITVKLSLIWICEVTVYFALTFAIKVFSGDFYLNLFIYSSVEIPIVILVGPLANYFGRKRCAVGMFSLSTVTCVGVAVTKLLLTNNDTNNAMVILILATLTKSLISGGRCVVSIITGELPPTVVRNLTYAFCMLFSRFGCIIAPHLVPDHNTLHVSFAIMAGLLLLTSAIFLTLPETSGRPMEDILERRSSAGVLDPGHRDSDSVPDDGQGWHSKNSTKSDVPSTPGTNTV